MEAVIFGKTSETRTEDSKLFRQISQFVLSERPFVKYFAKWRVRTHAERPVKRAGGEESDGPRWVNCAMKGDLVALTNNRSNDILESTEGQNDNFPRFPVYARNM